MRAFDDHTDECSERSMGGNLTRGRASRAQKREGLRNLFIVAVQGVPLLLMQSDFSCCSSLQASFLCFLRLQTIAMIS